MLRSNISFVYKAIRDVPWAGFTGKLKLGVDLNRQFVASSEYV